MKITYDGLNSKEESIGPGLTTDNATTLELVSKEDVAKMTLVDIIKLLGKVQDVHDQTRILRAVIAYYGLEEEFNN